MIRSYKMTDDTGFAPNPYHNYLTLATCKAGIRNVAKVDDTIIGFTSHTLNRDPVGNERIVFVMRVNYILTHDEYFNHQQFQIKKYRKGDWSNLVGDNIYFLKNGVYEKTQSLFHNDEKEIYEDLKSDKVLISDDFYYFGAAPIKIPEELKINVPIAVTKYGVITNEKEIESKLWKHLQSEFHQSGIISKPFGLKKSNQRK